MINGFQVSWQAVGVTVRDQLPPVTKHADIAIISNMNTEPPCSSSRPDSPQQSTGSHVPWTLPRSRTVVAPCESHPWRAAARERGIVSIAPRHSTSPTEDGPAMKAPAAASHRFPLNKSRHGETDTSAAAAAATAVGDSSSGGGGGGGVGSDACPHLSRPPPSAATDRGSSRSSPVVVIPHNRADRPVRSAGRQQQRAVGIPPAPSSTFNAVGIPRVSERREAGQAASPNAARPGGIGCPLPAAHVGDVQAPLVVTTRVLTRGDGAPKKTRGLLCTRVVNVLLLY